MILTILIHRIPNSRVKVNFKNCYIFVEETQFITLYLDSKFGRNSFIRVALSN